MSISAKVLLNRLMAKARFRHFEVLVRLSELGSVKRTAESIGMTQPGVTQLLADLEDLLEVKLFHRHARGVMPTQACQDLLPMARQCLLPRLQLVFDGSVSWESPFVLTHCGLLFARREIELAP